MQKETIIIKIPWAINDAKKYCSHEIKQITIATDRAKHLMKILEKALGEERGKTKMTREKLHEYWFGNEKVEYGELNEHAKDELIFFLFYLRGYFWKERKAK